MFNPQKILVLAPHTDDGELGCGASIAKFCSEGKEVYYAAFSISSRSLPPTIPPDTLKKECEAAVPGLGIDLSRLVIFDYGVREFPLKRQDILEDMVKLNKSIQPDLILLPGFTDVHQDHQVIHREGLRAFKYSSVLGYELPWNQKHFRSDLFIKVSRQEVDRKITAIRTYQSQAHRNYMQEDFISSLARVRGVQCNALYAEAFEVYRLIS